MGILSERVKICSLIVVWVGYQHKSVKLRHGNLEKFTEEKRVRLLSDVASLW